MDEIEQWTRSIRSHLWGLINIAEWVNKTDEKVSDRVIKDVLSPPENITDTEPAKEEPFIHFELLRDGLTLLYRILRHLKGEDYLQEGIKKIDYRGKRHRTNTRRMSHSRR